MRNAWLAIGRKLNNGLKMENTKMLINQIKTPSDLKRFLDEMGKPFFNRETMRFFGDTMANFGLRKFEHEGRQLLELYRKKPVNHGLQKSHYFDAETLQKISID